MKFSLFVLVLLNINLLRAQNYLDDGSFENFSCQQINSCNNGITTFDGALCSLGWNRSHGSPFIANVANGGAMGLNDNRYAKTWYSAVHNTGEGIYVDLKRTMYSGNTYGITAWGWNRTTSSTLNRALIKASSLLTSNGTCFNGTVIPTTAAETIQDIALNNGTDDWYKILDNYLYTPTNDYTQLWFYPFTSNHDEQLDLLWDGVTLCPSILKLNTTFKLNEYEHVSVSNYIEVGSLGNVILGNTTESILEASNYINFMPNTIITATSSSNLLARINSSSGCTNIAYRSSGGIDDIPINIERNDDQLFFPAPVDTTIGVSEVLINSISIYPNPAHNLVTISGTEANGTVQVIDITGKVIVSLKSQLKATSIDLAEIEKGIYFVKYTNNNAFSTEKLIIK